MKGAKMLQRHFDWYDMPELSFGVSVCAQVTSPMRPALPSTKSSRRPDNWKWCNFSDLGSTSTIPVTTGLWYLYILCGFLSISLSLAGASQGVVSKSTGLVSRLFKSKSLEYFQNLPKPTKHCCPQSASSWMCAILPHPFFLSPLRRCIKFNSSIRPRDMVVEPVKSGYMTYVIWVLMRRGDIKISEISFDWCSIWTFESVLSMRWFTLMLQQSVFYEVLNNKQVAIPLVTSMFYTSDQRCQTGNRSCCAALR